MEFHPPFIGNLYENLDDGNWFIYNGKKWVELTKKCPTCGRDINENR
jgi:hypothetical protein